MNTKMKKKRKKLSPKKLLVDLIKRNMELGNNHSVKEKHRVTIIYDYRFSIVRTNVSDVEIANISRVIDPKFTEIFEILIKQGVDGS